MHLSRPFSATLSTPVRLKCAVTVTGSAALPMERTRSMAAGLVCRTRPIMSPLCSNISWFVSWKMLFESGMIFNKKRSIDVTKNLRKEDIQMANKCIKRHSVSNVIRDEVQPQTYRCGENPKAWQHRMLARMWSSRNFPFGKSLMVSCKAKYDLTI